MGPAFMLSVWQRPLKAFLHRGPHLFTPRKSLPLPARFLCTKESVSVPPGRRETCQGDSARGGAKSSAIRYQGEGARKTTSVRKTPAFPKSVFAAGTAKRTAEMLRRKSALLSQDEDERGVEEARCLSARGAERVQPPERPLSAAEWKNLKESTGNPPRFDLHMMEAMLNPGVQLDVAKSLLTFVATETGTLSYSLLLRYLMLCVRGGHHDEVLDIYGIMRESFPSLDTGASTLFIKSFSQTARWREAFSILQELKKVFSPSAHNYRDVIGAALRHGDAATAWALYDEQIEKGMTPSGDTWDTLFQGVRNMVEEGSAGSQQEKLLGILDYMRNNQVYPQHVLANSIRSWFESLKGQKWTGSWTRATPEGVCDCCGSQLESIQLTAEEYRQLKDSVMTNVIQGRDVFNKTTPEELERFKQFVKKRPPFDVVVDGLNVANIHKDKSKLSETLLAVVSELERRGLKILVLGRRHMLRGSTSWDRRDMDLIHQKAHCFFTDNISEDDPFLLYATLHSGQHCLFVSRDLMRDHKACLPYGAVRRLFFKWQRGHQLVVQGHVTAGRRVRFLSIPSYDTIVQTTADSWHLPYDDTDDRSTYEVPQRWLCLTRKP